MNRSLWAVLFGTFTLRFSTGLTGATLTFYLAHLHDHEGILDQVLGLGPGPIVGSLTFGIIGALFFVSELTLSPVFGVVSDRLGHHPVMQLGPLFGVVAGLWVGGAANLPIPPRMAPPSRVPAPGGRARPPPLHAPPAP